LRWAGGYKTSARTRGQEASRVQRRSRTRLASELGLDSEPLARLRGALHTCNPARAARARGQGWRCWH
jgi:hypothetical protein